MCTGPGHNRPVLVGAAVCQRAPPVQYVLHVSLDRRAFLAAIHRQDFGKKKHIYIP
jgi:hypothetical protein